MAEGGISGSVLMAEGQEEYFDFNCGQCEAEGKFVEAIAYCPECPMYACGRCLEFHKRFLPTKDHVTFDRNRKSEWGKVKRVSRSGVECKEHDGEIVTMFCGEHDALCCSVCVSLDHRTCRNMSFIPHIAKGIATSDRLKQTKAKADQTLIDISRAKAIQKGDQEFFKTSKSVTLKEVADYRKEVNTAFDHFEEQLHLQINDISNPIVDEIESTLTVCENMEESVRRLKTALQNTDNRSDTEIFVDMKICQQKLIGNEYTIKKASMPIAPKLEFVANTSLLKDIKKAAYMGKVETNTTRTNQVYTISEQEEQHTRNVKLSDDANVCFIDGMCQLPGGQIVLTDKPNKRLKLLDADYNVNRHFDVPDRPYAVCCIGDTDIAVALADTTVHLINIGDDIKTTKILRLGHKSHGLAYHSGSLYVSDHGTRVDVYDLSGKRIRTLQRDASGNYIFAQARHVAVSSGGSRIYVPDKDKGLIVLGTDGQPLSTLAAPELQGSRGICMDTHGNVFVACCLSHKVVQVNNKGDKVIGVLVGRKHGLHFPGMALFDRVRSRLLVANIPAAGSNTMCVYKIDIQS